MRKFCESLLNQPGCLHVFISHQQFVRFAEPLLRFAAFLAASPCCDANHLRAVCTISVPVLAGNAKRILGLGTLFSSSKAADCRLKVERRASGVGKHRWNETDETGIWEVDGSGGIHILKTLLLVGDLHDLHQTHLEKTALLFRYIWKPGRDSIHQILLWKTESTLQMMGLGVQPFVSAGVARL